MAELQTKVRRVRAPRSPESLRGQRLSQARLIEAVRSLPREQFYPAETIGTIAYDQPVPLENGSTIPPVPVVALMIGALELIGSERVLEIGAGSFYQTALLSRLASEVITIQVDQRAADRARGALERAGCANVEVHCGDPRVGWPAKAPYQGIIMGAAVSELPVELIEQLEVGGRLVVALGDRESQLVERLRKRVDGLDSETMGCCRLDLLGARERVPSSFPWTNGLKE
ncbi:MAG: protein-L-isoaspartate O-methyltransferase family protein [Myxococcota bacterium]